MYRTGCSIFSCTHVWPEALAPRAYLPSWPTLYPTHHLPLSPVQYLRLRFVMLLGRSFMSPEVRRSLVREMRGVLTVGCMTMSFWL